MVSGTQKFSVKRLTSFNNENETIIVFQRNIISMNPKTISILSTTGSTLFTISSSISEGENIGMDVTVHYLTIFTMEGYLKIYNLSGICFCFDVNNFEIKEKNSKNVSQNRSSYWFPPENNYSSDYIPSQALNYF